MSRYSTSSELEAQVGEHFRSLRLRANIQQVDLALRADVSLSAIKNLETGKGTTLRTVVRVAKALGRTDWLDSLGPEISVSPLEMLKNRPQRQRAARKGKRDGV